MRIQHTVRHGRTKTSSLVIKEINKAVEQTAYRFDCSKSWVIAVALGEFFGIEVETYTKEGKRQ